VSELIGISTSEQIARAIEVLGDRASIHRSLAAFTTYRLGGPAAIFVEAHNLNDLTAVAEAHTASGLAVLVVGRGSNLLIDDAGFHGIAVRLAEGFDQIVAVGTPDDREQGGLCRLRVGAAVALPVLARRTAAMGLQGMEWAVGVPGSVGGAVRMNAGGHGSDMAASLISAEVFNFASRKVQECGVADLGLRFRGSDLTDAEVVVSVVLELEPGSVEASTAKIAEIVQWRREHQPGGHNCGSVFVNPIPGQISAGELIDRCGLRGARHGGALVSPKHANFIQAEESATAADVRALIEHVREVVEEKTGITLRSEVRIIGPEVAQ
jgi:UDP-N-acetylmuramate dehydrogenase